jgi:hypothetical protein
MTAAPNAADACNNSHTGTKPVNAIFNLNIEFSFLGQSGQGEGFFSG